MLEENEELPAVPIKAAAPLVEGWLDMKEDDGSWFTMWKRYYFKLDQEHQELRYYKKMKPSEFGSVTMDELGCIPISLINEVQCRYDGWSKGRGFHIQYSRYGQGNFPNAYMAGNTHGLDLNRKTYIFRAVESKDRQHWVRNLSHLVEMLRQARRGTDELLEAAKHKVSRLDEVIAEKMGRRPPYVASAKAALSSIDSMAIIDLKSMANPDKYVLNVLKAVAILFAGCGNASKGFLQAGVLSTQLTWSRVREMLQDGNVFMKELQGYHHKLETYSVPDDNIIQVRQLAAFPSFLPSSVSHLSPPAAALCEWVLCMLSYFDLLHEIQSTRDLLNEAKRQLEQTARDFHVSQSEEGQRLMAMMPGGADRKEIELDATARLGFLNDLEKTTARITSISIPYGAVTSLLSKEKDYGLNESGLHGHGTHRNTSYMSPSRGGYENDDSCTYTDEEEQEEGSYEDDTTLGSPIARQREASLSPTKSTRSTKSPTRSVMGGSRGINIDTTSRSRSASPVKINLDRLKQTDVVDPAKVLTPTQVLRCYSTAFRNPDSPLSPREKRVQRANRLMSALRGSPTNTTAPATVTPSHAVNRPSEAASPSRNMAKRETAAVESLPSPSYPTPGSIPTSSSGSGSSSGGGNMKQQRSVTITPPNKLFSRYTFEEVEAGADRVEGKTKRLQLSLQGLPMSPRASQCPLSPTA